ncbi:hypothetical protein NE237_013948 [Protea cynaroides]|uniref:Uncharacterized protein n=1 Tax=Protea cynaroides TaxID=273540 RepID=A0A9Q0H0V6_9MAGN|nr:hypothetical protein NE237_013948 [Protea cynaroides]
MIWVVVMMRETKRVLKNLGKLKGIEPKSMDSGEFSSYSGEDGSFRVKVENAEGDSGSISGDYKPEFEPEGPNGSDSGAILEIAADMGEVTKGIGPVSDKEVKAGEEEMREIVWWKLPHELLKFCVFRISLVWSVTLYRAQIVSNHWKLQSSIQQLEFSGYLTIHRSLETIFTRAYIAAAMMGVVILGRRL